MPTRRPIDPDVLSALLRERERVVTHSQLREAGVPPSTLVRRMRPEGPWQFAHPGVVIAHRGTPTQREQILAAMAYAGDAAVLTGPHALAAAGLRRPPPGPIQILIPAERRRASRPGVMIERTRRPPAHRMRSGIEVADPARALFDTCRTTQAMEEVRDLVSSVVQAGLTSVADFAEEVFSGPRQRSALGRVAFEEVRAGVRSVAEARARTRILGAGLPEPLWNHTLLDEEGNRIATPDAFWEVGVVLEIDSMRWHLNAAAYRQTQARQRRMAAKGIIVLPVAPHVVSGSDGRWLDEIFSALSDTAAARRHTRLGVHAVAPR